MSGSEALSMIKADTRTKDIPVTVISADATEPQIRRLLGSGARSYLTKPLDVRRFLGMLDAELWSADARA
ncbi:MAG: response regulator [Actinomycetota bacterium]